MAFITRCDDDDDLRAFDSNSFNNVCIMNLWYSSSALLLNLGKFKIKQFNLQAFHSQKNECRVK